MTDTLTITRPDDWHIHLRDDTALPRTVGDAARLFSRAIVMPNLQPPVTDSDKAATYRQRILQAAPAGSGFSPLMTLYLTDQTSPEIIRQATQEKNIYAAKLYPAGATTNSASGVTDIKHIYPALAAMEECGMVLSVHGEVTDSAIDIFDREKAFIDSRLKKIVSDFPKLKVVFEHISTSQAVEFVKQSSELVAATITAHHLLLNRDDMLAGGIRPHYYCLPILKRREHQQALIAAATSGSPRFFIGTDSAPHARQDKESACGCAGSYTAYAAIELYAEVFERAGALDKLEAFTSFYGADFYQLPRNNDTITLLRQPWQAPASLDMGEHQLIPFKAGETINWQVKQ